MSIFSWKKQIRQDMNNSGCRGRQGMLKWSQPEITEGIQFR